MQRKVGSMQDVRPPHTLEHAEMSGCLETMEKIAYVNK